MRLVDETAGARTWCEAQNAATFAFQMIERCLIDEECAPRIDGEYAIPIIDRDRFRRRGRCATCRMDDRVKPAQRFDGSRKSLFHSRFLGNVAMDKFD